MKIIQQYLSLLVTACLLAACKPLSQPSQPPATERIKAFAQQHYGQQLILTAAQIEQLAWVEENPFYTPEATSKASLHPEVPRALARLYNLQRLRAGTPADYRAFIAPQISAGNHDALSKQSFDTLAHPIQAMDQSHYEVLTAASIISAVALSPEAIHRAKKYLGDSLPADSTQFLSATAPYANTIYPLAHAVINKHPDAKALFETVFMPNSHLRHMLYNEGSLSMYSHLEKGIRSGQLRPSDLELWYSYWVANIAGFRGHLSASGSLYLDQPTFEAINSLYTLFQGMFEGKTQNPMVRYLQQRADWLGLSTQTLSTNERLALGALGAMLRYYTPDAGNALVTGFKQLDNNNQHLWVTHVLTQLHKQPFPSDTYGPAVFANTLKQSTLQATIKAVIPLYNSVLLEAQRMRQSHQLAETTPVSFHALARSETILFILQHPQMHYPVSINPQNGVATLQQLHKRNF